MDLRAVFHGSVERTSRSDEYFSEDEVRLANRNSGILLEALSEEITPTGLHYLLTHFDVPTVDPAHYRLEFEAGFEAPHSLSLDDIRALPAVTMPVTMECAGNGRRGVSPRSQSMPWGYEAVGTAVWTGTPLAPLIAQAKPRGETVDFAFFGADRGFDGSVEHTFGRSLTPDEIGSLDAMVVYEMNGQPLLPQHGAPVRLIVPGWYGMASVKWLTRIEALSERFQGFQQVRTYRYRDTRDEPGHPVTDIRVKSLMIPPGLPDWSSRARYLRPGRVTVEGRAWSGSGRSIARVEFGAGGAWQEARLHTAPGAYAWTGWSCDWTAEPGEHMLLCRATDEEGNVQPVEPPWDVAGFGNNAVQRVPVLVDAD